MRFPWWSFAMALWLTALPGCTVSFDFPTFVGVTRWPEVDLGPASPRASLDFDDGFRIATTPTFMPYWGDDVFTRAEGLGLAVGAQAFALVKASSIVVVTEAEGAHFSARNRLDGTVARIAAGAVNDEVVIDVADGVSIAAIITHASSEALGLAVGARATAIFKASSVIVGAPA